MPVAELSKLLRGPSAPIQKILITGASGWIGRETIARLQPILGEEFSHRVTLAGSRNTNIVVNGRAHQIQGLFDLDPTQEFDFVVHLAYLTQEKVDTLGTYEFSRQVNRITSFVHQLCTQTPVKYVFVASSGAADPQVWGNYKSPSKKTYGRLKRESEALFKSLNYARVEIGRIWSISGSQLQNHQKYALSDFIIQAKSTGNIQMHASSLVERAYVDAGEMMEVFILNLLKGGTGILDSGGFKTSLQDLARLVLKEFHPEGELVLPSEGSFAEKDIYVPNVGQFNELAGHLGVKLSSLEDQIRTTAKALSSR